MSQSGPIQNEVVFFDRLNIAIVRTRIGFTNFILSLFCQSAGRPWAPDGVRVAYKPRGNKLEKSRDSGGTPNSPS